MLFVSGRGIAVSFLSVSSMTCLLGNEATAKNHYIINEWSVVNESLTSVSIKFPSTISSPFSLGKMSGRFTTVSLSMRVG